MNRGVYVLKIVRIKKFKMISKKNNHKLISLLDGVWNWNVHTSTRVSYYVLYLRCEKKLKTARQSKKNDMS